MTVQTERIPHLCGVVFVAQYGETITAQDVLDVTEGWQATQEACVHVAVFPKSAKLVGVNISTLRASIKWIRGRKNIAGIAIFVNSDKFLIAMAEIAIKITKVKLEIVGLDDEEAAIKLAKDLLKNLC